MLRIWADNEVVVEIRSLNGWQVMKRWTSPSDTVRWRSQQVKINQSKDKQYAGTNDVCRNWNALQYDKQRIGRRGDSSKPAVAPPASRNGPNPSAKSDQ